MAKKQQHDLRNVFDEAVKSSLAAEDVVILLRSLRAQDGKASAADRMALAGKLARAAFLEPDRVGTCYDAMVMGWFGYYVQAEPIPELGRPPLEPSGPLWDEFWQIVEDGKEGALDAGSITSRTAGLAAHMGEEASERAVETAKTYPGVMEVLHRPIPPKIEIQQIKNCPKKSLARQFHTLIDDNDFDLEVLDREAIGLSELPKPLDYLNTRILQAHDLWHIVAGYETTALHEVAISSFQLAQFGHNYSAQFLSVAMAITAQAPPSAFPIFLDTVAAAWIHGRETPPMMAIPWEEEWQKSAKKIRQQYDIEPFKSPYPPNLLELFQGNVLQKTRGGVGLLWSRLRYKIPGET